MKKGEKSIYILLTDTGTFFTKTIKFYTNAPYNHASIAFDKNLQEIYSFGRKNPNNPFSGGFVQEDVYMGTYRHFEHTMCSVLELSVTNCQFERMKQVINNFQFNPEVYSYNLLGLLGFIFQYPIEVENAYFCSEFVAEVLQKCEIDVCNKLPSLTTPHDFLESNSFKKIYEGELYHYPSLLTEKLCAQPKRHKLNKIFSLFQKKGLSA